MSQLDQSPPPLPLWTEAAPVLPTLNPSPPLDSRPPPLGHITGAMGHGVAPNGSANGGSMRAMSPMSPKLVTSPQALHFGGLQVRDEFKPLAPVRDATYALLTLTTPASIRLTGFPPEVLVSVDRAVSDAWPLGVRSRSESAESLKKRANAVGMGADGVPGAWKIELEGKAWKRQGSSELDSVRLMIALLTALATHGWTVVDRVAAGSTKRDVHNLLFQYSAEVQTIPPAFFALSIPVPDRISLVFPPPRCTPALISSLRGAIVSQASPSTKHSRAGTASTGATANTGIASGSITGVSMSGNGNGNGGRVTWNKWNGGSSLRGGGLKQAVVDNLHPSLLLSILSTLSSQHFQLALSLPLLPATPGRDILIFSSFPSGGLSYRDNYAFHPSALTSVSAESRSESPVLVSPLAASPAPGTGTDSPTRSNTNTNPSPYPNIGTHLVQNETTTRSPRGRRLPWASTLLGSSAAPTPQNTLDVPPENTAGPAFPSDDGGLLTTHAARVRMASDDSRNPLLDSGGGSGSPRQRNLLLKKSSLRKRTGTEAPAPRSRRHSEDNLGADTSTRADRPRGGLLDLTPEPNADRAEEWSMVHMPPTNDISTTTIPAAGLSRNTDPGRSQLPAQSFLAEQEDLGLNLENFPSVPAPTGGVSPRKAPVALPIPVPTPSASAYPHDQPGPAESASRRRTSTDSARRGIRHQPSIDASDSGTSAYEDAYTPFYTPAEGIPGLGGGPTTTMSGPLTAIPGSATSGGTSETTAAATYPGDGSVRDPVALPLRAGGAGAPLLSPKSPQRGREFVDVGNGIGVSSMVGSVGYSPSTLSAAGISPSSPRGTEVTGATGVTGVTGMTRGSAVAGTVGERGGQIKKVWDEQARRWTEMEEVPIEYTGPAAVAGAASAPAPPAAPAAGAGAGSSRTKVRLSAGGSGSGSSLGR
ncbi:hypothetical protein EHS25_009094 [Saitozyma podzolica]|uniref:Uncharacterized protein n=1 Tax=Saitozyma podzolica TaxID=1890683 RepID=A0A427YKU4_9TREE|nr:hypothetical protein EHS25_009094 [Saitozyma podzolica]